MLYKGLLILASSYLFCLFFLNFVLKLFTGLSIGFFNPFKFKLCNIRFKNKIKIELIEFSPFRKRVRIAGVTLSGIRNNDSKKSTKVSKKNVSPKKEKKPFKLPSIVKKYIPTVLRSIDNLHIIADRINFKDEGLKIETIGTILSYDTKTKFLSYEIFLRKAYTNETVILTDSTFSTKGNIIIDNVGNSVPVDQLSFDFKLGVLTLPMTYLKQLKNSKKGSQVVNETVMEQGGVEGKELVEEEIGEADIRAALLKIRSALDKVRTTISPVFEINFYMDKLLIMDLPMTKLPQLSTVSEKLTYHVCASNVTLNLIKFQKSYPGFKLSFNDDDTPIKINANFSRANAALSIRRDGSDTPQVCKFLEIPNMNVFGHSNILSQNFNYDSDNILENALSSLKFQISSILLDIDIETLSFAKSFKQNVKVFEGAFSDAVKLSKGGSEGPSKGKRILQSYFSSLFPVLNMKFSVEDTKVVISDGDDSVIYSLSVLSVDFKSVRTIKPDPENEKLSVIHYQTETCLELSNMNCIHVKCDGSGYKHTILHLDSAALKHVCAVTPEYQITLDGDIHHIDFDLSELQTMVALNRIQKRIDYQILNVEETYFKDLYEEFASTLTSTELQCSALGDKMDAKKESPEKYIFRELPSFFDYIKIDISDISVTLGARSVFMPPKNFSSMESQSPKDLVDGKIRKFSNRVDKLQIALFGNSTQWRSKIEGGKGEMVKSSDSSGYRNFEASDLDDISTTESTEVQHLWNFNILVNSFKSVVMYETCQMCNEFSPRTVSKLDVLSLKVFPDTDGFSSDSKNKLIIQMDGQKINSATSLMNVFMTISGIHTIKQIFGKDDYSYKEESSAKKFFVYLNKLKKKSFFQTVDWKLLKPLIVVNISFESIKQVVILPTEVKMRIECFNTFISVTELNQISFTGDHIRVCVESPTVESSWTRLILINKYAINANIAMIKDQVNKGFDSFDELESAVTLSNESWHFNIPDKFQMFKIFDSITTIVKAIKQMKYSLKTSDNTLVIFAKKVNPAKVPKVKVKSNRCVFTLEDDPLESELNMIFQIGLEEQRSRLAKLEEFERRVAPKVKPVKRKASSMSHHSNNNVPPSPDSNSSNHTDYSVTDMATKLLVFNAKLGCSLSKKIVKGISGVSPSSKVSGNELDMLIESEFIPEEQFKAFQRLQENISTSWIKRVQQYKKKEKEEFKNNFSYLWGNINYLNLPEDINQKVVDFIQSPSLSTMIFEGIDIDIFKPACGLDGIPSFINRIGNGVPMDTEYSIMFPMYVDAKFSEVRWHLRDYPLPFVFIPPTTANQKDPHSLRIYGNFLVTEDMMKSEREVRTIYVPLVPSVIMENMDTYYSLTVPRTVTSVKMYTDLQLDIKSNETTKVTWGASYSPAIQQTMQCLENFSKPPTDRSPKPGFWDKLSYIFHAKININWVNSGKFEISLLGAKNPYLIGGKYAGFVVGFKGDINLTCNEKNDPSKFLSCTADKVHFSIPNYFAKPLLVWSRPTSEAIFVPNQDNTNLQKLASYYYLINLDSTKSNSANVQEMYSSYIEKTGIKLSGGMTLCLGFVFERLADGLNRSLEFKPHWLTRTCNPIYVDDFATHDSYAGFRSNFIHMSLTLLSNSDTAYNALQLNPSALQTFFSWWRTFSGNLPVRRGKLYTAQNLSPKFGDCLRTISYRADVQPLYVTYMQRNINPTEVQKHSYYDNIEFAGIKAKVSHFIMDLHQRKEVIYEFKETLNIGKKVLRMKFLEADIHTDEIDIRTVHGEFKKAAFVEDMENAVYNIFDNDKSWIDLSDFKEAFSISCDAYVPTVDIQALLFSEQFVYKKRAKYGDKYQIDAKTSQPITPFQNCVSHNCSLGQRLKIPRTSINKRLHSLKTSENILKEKIDHSDNTKIIKHDTLLLKTTKNAVKKVEELVQDLDTLFYSQDDPTKGNYHFNIVDQTAAQHMQSFENQYWAVNMLLKWNESNRDTLLKFAMFMSINNHFSNLPLHKSLRVFDDIVRQKLSLEKTHSKGRTGNGINDNPQNINLNVTEDESLEDLFEKGLKELFVGIQYNVNEDHFVQFMSPQIQLMTEQDPDSCVIITAPSTRLRVLSFDGTESSNTINNDKFLKRFGIFVPDANLFVFHKDDYKDYFELFFDVNSYGQTKSGIWPPWLGLELCLDPTPLAAEALVKNLSTVFYYDNVYQFSSSYEAIKDDLQSRMMCYLPDIIVSSTSRNYLSLYKVATNLLMHIELSNVDLKNRAEKFAISYDFDDLTRLYQSAEKLSSQVRILNIVENELLFREKLLDDAGQVDLFNVHNEKINTLSKLYVLMSVLCSKRKEKEGASKMMVWNIKINKVILHMLNNDMSPFLDVISTDIKFKRIASTSGFNRNSVTIKSSEIIHLEKNAVYENLLSPYVSKKDLRNSRHDSDQPFLAIEWVMDKPVGGIKVLKDVETHVSGVQLSIEETTLMKLIHWLLPNEIASMLKSDDKGGENDSLLDMESLDSEIRVTGSEAELNEMLQRSTDFVIMENVTLNGFKLCISFKGKGAKRLINVSDFLFNFPTLRFDNQTMRVIDLLLVLKKILVKALLRQSGRFLVSKLKTRNPASDHRKTMMIEATSPAAKLEGEAAKRQVISAREELIQARFTEENLLPSH
ncbi:hypothetical protein Kpol_1013p50 [Vanderwaltozyma polyspora DSM 70294]|uniref:FMP27 GFWDK domain-containing protein n=1 Tax=Vanderwaltozyma polyspora (strain ATCC 22028 / DSM 70294 / BCRC 21397 / CBS 2163 / NBRC 10782 / NRRL Y-8283 / UCD 57-17) TaxID=436907 RepID=A7TH97_VANPO|nr:uncharacterized protein Kpol_1013p50 [Vanderwaltozyma polyspora DSM 70294]EDO18378.1 hypothetical protein Kpol_1013p50 [Vanderwaltozyma polyspora DSM 70294]